MNCFKKHLPKIIPSRPGALPIALSLARVSGLRKLIEEKSRWTPESNCISPGILAETLVAALLCGCRPVYKVEEFFIKNNFITTFYKGEGIHPKQLNDDAYARMLDILSTLDCQRLIETLCLQMLQYHGLGITLTHSDTTSVTVEGIYATGKEELAKKKPSEELFCINFGRSKKNEIARQIKLGVSVQENGLPLSGKLLSGNTSDKNWTPQAVDVLSSMLSENGYKDTIFVADSAVISTESIHTFKRQELQFISRFPETFTLARDLKMEAWEKNEWEDIGTFIENNRNAAHYKTWSAERKIEGVSFGFVVVHSSKLAERKEKTLLKSIETTKKGFETQSKELAKRSFVCAADAEKEALRLQKIIDNKGFQSMVEINEVMKMKYAHKGRPKKGEEPTQEISWTVDLKVGLMKKEVYEQKRKEASTFVLIYNIKEDKSSAEILKFYKNQDKVEQNFRFLKMPQYFGVIYTKLPSRVKALGYIFLIVLLLAKYLEYRVRIGMRYFKGVLKIGGQKFLSPSAKTILEELSEMCVHEIDGERMVIQNIYCNILQIIKWSGFDENVYINGHVNDLFSSEWRENC